MNRQDDDDGNVAWAVQHAVGQFVSGAVCIEVLWTEVQAVADAVGRPVGGAVLEAVEEEVEDAMGDIVGDALKGFTTS